MKNFKKLKIWLKGMEIVIQTYEMTRQLPKQEKYNLTSQSTSAAVSIPSNIAEGSAKRSKKEYIRFLEYSLGSAYELETQVLIIDRLEYADKTQTEKLLAAIDEEQKMIQSFIISVEKG